MSNETRKHDFQASLTPFPKGCEALKISFAPFRVGVDKGDLGKYFLTYE
jgi:hypothetical protein